MAASYSNRSQDWVARPSGWILWWCLPILIGFSIGFLGLRLALASFIWAALFAWMGTGCLVNAWRCGRLHCFISGPVFWLGAAAAALVGAGVFGGAHSLNNIISIAFVVALLSFVPEMIWGRYARRG